MALQDPAPVALPFHTFVLASFFILLALAGARMNSQLPQQHTDASLLYISLIAGQWGLLYYVSKAHSVSDLIGGRWQSWVDVVADVGVAIVQWAAFWGASWLFVRAWIRFIGRGHAASVRNLLPVRAHEIALWILLSISAGICEEVVFRGYFLRQFAAFTKSWPLGLILQAILFGIAHGYQGIASCMRIVLFGLIYGGVAMWRRSLRSGMIAHAATDIIGGLF